MPTESVQTDCIVWLQQSICEGVQVSMPILTHDINVMHHHHSKQYSYAQGACLQVR
jgi:hypothetical protein